ncbi:MAG: EAL domain-containing protein, partial [Kordiimonadaceae bacterium]|nr:EAL domain-containing protein [Kordiimonadaceae bacterium]
TMDMMKDESSLSLVEAVIRMGHSFNLNVIAEGVETEEQLTRLLSMKCDQAQGFFIKRPDDADNITQWLKEKYT